jgi:hypothetical protein
MVNYANCVDAFIIRHKDGGAFYMPVNIGGELLLMPLFGAGDQPIDFYGEKKDWSSYDLAEAQMLSRDEKRLSNY